MPILPPTSARRRVMVALAAFSLLVASCAGQRPILTTDRLDESAGPVVTPPATEPATAVPDVPAAEPQDSAAPAEPAGATDGSDTEAADTTEEAVAAPETPLAFENLTVEVVESFPHDPNAFTQGLELHDGVLLESTGKRGRSDLRWVTVETGEVRQIVPTPNDWFAEGATKVGDRIIQLTWTEERAFFWDAQTLELVDEVAYTGEGWGLCYDGQRLVQTDGTPTLIFRDATTFAETGRIAVSLDGQPVAQLNEIECVNGQVWANIWRTNLIVRIDPSTGFVTATVDAASLERPESANVLNGIAWDESTSTFLVTGKLWPTMYRVNFVPAPTP